MEAGRFAVNAARSPSVSLTRACGICTRPHLISQEHLPDHLFAKVGARQRGVVELQPLKNNREPHGLVGVASENASHAGRYRPRGSRHDACASSLRRKLCRRQNGRKAVADLACGVGAASEREWQQTASSRQVGHGEEENQSISLVEFLVTDSQ